MQRYCTAGEIGGWLVAEKFMARPVPKSIRVDVSFWQQRIIWRCNEPLLPIIKSLDKAVHTIQNME
jgi:hypothetical protein